MLDDRSDQANTSKVPLELLVDYALELVHYQMSKRLRNILRTETV